MFKNTLIEFLENYDYAKPNVKAKLLQSLENELAADQNRTPRIIIPTKVDFLTQLLSNRQVKTHYNPASPQYIFYNIDGDVAIYAAYSLIHTSFEAYLDDFSKGLTDLNLYSSDYSTEEVLLSLALEPKIKESLISHNKLALENAFIKNALGHKEAAMYIIDKIVSSIETPEDLEKYATTVFDVMYGYLESIKKLEEAEKSSGTKYDDMYETFYQRSLANNFADAGDLANAKEVHGSIYPAVEKTFNELLKSGANYIYSELYEGKFEKYTGEQVKRVQFEAERKLNKTLLSNFKFFI